MEKEKKDKLRKQLTELQQQILELPMDENGNPKDKKLAKELSEKEFDLITKIYGDA